MAQVERRVRPADVGAAAGWLEPGCSRADWSLTLRQGLRRVHRFPVVGQHRPSRPRRGMGKSAALGTLVRHAAILSSSLSPRTEPKRRSAGWRRSWPASGCVCIPKRRGSCTSCEGVGGFDFLGFHPPEDPVESGIAATCRGGRHHGPWPQSGPRSVITPTPFAGRELHQVVADLNPVLRGWGAYFGYGNSAASSPSSTATCTCGCPSWPASSTPPEADFDQPVQLCLADRSRHLSTHWESPVLGDCACLTMNGVGKPCAGEPHARFDRGPLERLKPRRDGTHAPHGKPAGLSPSAPPAYRTSGLPHHPCSAKPSYAPSVSDDGPAIRIVRRLPLTPPGRRWRSRSHRVARSGPRSSSKTCPGLRGPACPTTSQVGRSKPARRAVRCQGVRYE